MTPGFRPSVFHPPLVALAPSASRIFPPSRRAFSLVELLTVIAIISILTGVLISNFSSVSARNFNAQSSEISEILARAREYAVANNTYTWVAFYTGAAGSVYAVSLSSVDGTSQILTPSGSLGSTANWSSNATDPTKYQLLDKVTVFPQVQISDSGTCTVASLPAVTSLSNLCNSTAQGPSFAINIPALGSQNFTRSVEFTPSGEAKVQAAINEAIEFDLSQMQGAAASTSKVAAIRINGFTGQSQVYQP